MKKYTKEEFLEKAKLTHDDLDNYDFSNFNIDDVDEKNRILITCKKHGLFRIRKTHFLNGQKCTYCSKYNKTDESVIEELSKIHPELDFSITKFSERDSKNRIKVICPLHRHSKY